MDHFTDTLLTTTTIFPMWQYLCMLTQLLTSPSFYSGSAASTLMHRTSTSIVNVFFRSTSYWHKYELWVEQCFRDTLKVVWNASDAEMQRLLPPDRPIWVSFYCYQQFIISREMVRSRPLSVWKQLQHILSEADVCHSGDPEYETLHAYGKRKIKIGPEPSLLPDTEYTNAPGTGRITQAVTSEHLAHVILQSFCSEMPMLPASKQDKTCHSGK